MPICFAFSRISEPGKFVPLVEIDEELCKHFGVPVDAWYQRR